MKMKYCKECCSLFNRCYEACSICNVGLKDIVVNVQNGNVKYSVGKVEGELNEAMESV
jgi:hypothetical protein